METLGVIAGNGRFPFLVVEEARMQGLSVVVAAIREEADEAWKEAFQDDPQVRLHWVALGRLGRLIRLFQAESVTQAVMAGQVQHRQIFARSSSALRRALAARPDWRMLKLLAGLPRKNTAAVIGAVIAELESEGIRLVDSTRFLTRLLPAPGVLTRRQPNDGEQRDIGYGRPIARQIAALDLGQTIVIRDQAVVAVEAMEGTDETVRRAARLVQGEPLTVVKVSRPGQDMRFDVPVLGQRTLKVFEECRVSALAIDAGKTLLLDREAFLAEADRLGLAIVAHEVQNG